MGRHASLIGWAPRVRALSAGVLYATWLGVSGGSLAAQPAPVQADAAGEEAVVDVTLLGSGPGAEMNALLERTIFQVDVLTLTLRVSPETAAVLEGLVRGRRYSDALADSVAAVALEERDAFARIVFKRGVSLDQLVDGIADNMEKAVEAGLLDRPDFERITGNLPIWFSFLEEEGTTTGDEILYRIRGDSLRTVYRTVEGEVLLDQVDVGPARRMAVLGSYFAPGSDFREQMIKSLLQPR